MICQWLITIKRARKFKTCDRIYAFWDYVTLITSKNFHHSLISWSHFLILKNCMHLNFILVRFATGKGNNFPSVTVMSKKWDKNMVDYANQFYSNRCSSINRKRLTCKFSSFNHGIVHEFSLYSSKCVLLGWVQN